MAVMDVGQLSASQEHQRHNEASKSQFERAGGTRFASQMAGGSVTRAGGFTQQAGAGMMIAGGNIPQGGGAGPSGRSSPTPSAGGGGSPSPRTDGLLNMGGPVGPAQAGAGMQNPGGQYDKPGGNITTPFNPWMQAPQAPGVGDNELRQQGAGGGGESSGKGRGPANDEGMSNPANPSKGGEDHLHGGGHGNDSKSLLDNPDGAKLWHDSANNNMHFGTQAIGGMKSGIFSVFEGNKGQQRPMTGPDGKPLGPAR